jgi:hypothetical protein
VPNRVVYTSTCSLAHDWNVARAWWLWAIRRLQIRCIMVKGCPGDEANHTVRSGGDNNDYAAVSCKIFSYDCCVVESAGELADLSRRRRDAVAAGSYRELDQTYCSPKAWCWIRLGTGPRKSCGRVPRFRGALRKQAGKPNRVFWLLVFLLYQRP